MAVPVGSVFGAGRCRRFTRVLVSHDLTERPAQLRDESGAPVLQHQGPEVAGVEELDSQARVQLSQAADLPVLLAHEPLLERGQLHEQLELRQEEVGGEALEDVAVEIPEDREDLGLVLPFDLIEVEDPGELGFAGVGEPGPISDREALPRRSSRPAQA